MNPQDEGESDLLSCEDRNSEAESQPLLLRDKEISICGLCHLTAEVVPHILFLSDFIIANGAGMSVNFFPLFFFREYALSPIQVSLLYLAQPILLTGSTFVAQVFSVRVGRWCLLIYIVHYSDLLMCSDMFTCVHFMSLLK